MSDQESKTSPADNFLIEQNKQVDELLDAVVADPKPGSDATNRLLDYARAAVSTVEDAVKAAWPSLRDSRSIPDEERTKIFMGGALVGMIGVKASQKFMSGDANLLAFGHILRMCLSSPYLKGAESQAVNAQVSADLLRNRAIEEEKQEQAATSEQNKSQQLAEEENTDESLPN